MANEAERAKEIDDAVKAADAKRKADAEAESGKIDKVLSCLDSLTKRMDAWEEEDKKKADAAKRKDGEDEEEIGKEKSDPKHVVADSRADSMTRNAELAEAQSRADKVASAFGRSAPRPMDGERVRDYRVRLMRDYKHNSADYKDTPMELIAELPPAVFEKIEARVFTDSLTAAASPSVPEGFLHEVKTRDASGRQISTFYGEPRAWMQQFSSPARCVKKFNIRRGDD